MDYIHLKATAASPPNALCRRTLIFASTCLNVIGIFACVCAFLERSWCIYVDQIPRIHSAGAAFQSPSAQSRDSGNTS